MESGDDSVLRSRSALPKMPTISDLDGMGGEGSNGEIHSNGVRIKLD